jgi:exodeoxyribonuclease VIII
MKFENGIHAITNEQYHSSEGISRSDLMRFKKSPMHFKHKQSLKETPSLIIGELVHTLVLEPNFFNDRYIVNPGFDRRTKEGKIEHAEFITASEGKRIVEANHFTEASKMAGAVNNHMFKQYLSQGYRVENSIFFRHELTGLQCKVRPDAWLGDIVIDLKTTADASFRSFQSSAYNYGYYLQAGMIKRALESLNKPIKNFIFVAVEKEAPYAIGIYKLDDEALEFGANEFDTLMVELNKYIQKNEFPDYGIQTLSIPAWLKTE